MRLADGVLLVVDALEGVGLAAERAVRQAVSEGLALTLLVSKVDRLITELKLPPADAYFKVRCFLVCGGGRVWCGGVRASE